MRRWRYILVLLFASLLSQSASAGINIFKKKPKPDPAQRVHELLRLVKSSPDELKRSDAADELREFDPAQFPEMIPILLEAMTADPKPSVRMSAMSTLAKIRPLSQDVGMGIEQSLAKDSSMRVRMHARSLLLQYHWAGYRTPKKEKDLKVPPSSKEPPLAQPMPEPNPQIQPLPKPTNPPVQQIITKPSGAQKMPAGPAQPITTPTPLKVPSKSEGPDLGSRVSI